MLSLGARTKIRAVVYRTLPEAMGADAEPPTDQAELAAGGPRRPQQVHARPQRLKAV